MTKFDRRARSDSGDDEVPPRPHAPQPPAPLHDTASASATAAATSTTTASARASRRATVVSASVATTARPLRALGRSNGDADTNRRTCARHDCLSASAARSRSSTLLVGREDSVGSLVRTERLEQPTSSNRRHTATRGAARERTVSTSAAVSRSIAWRAARTCSIRASHLPRNQRG